MFIVKYIFFFSLELRGLEQVITSLIRVTRNLVRHLQSSPPSPLDTSVNWLHTCAYQDIIHIDSTTSNNLTLLARLIPFLASLLSYTDVNTNRLLRIFFQFVFHQISNAAFLITTYYPDRTETHLIHAILTFLHQWRPHAFTSQVDEFRFDYWDSDGIVQPPLLDFHLIDELLVNAVLDSIQQFLVVVAVMLGRLSFSLVCLL